MKSYQEGLYFAAGMCDALRAGWQRAEGAESVAFHKGFHMACEHIARVCREKAVELKEAPHAG